jgi:ECF sigma factor
MSDVTHIHSAIEQADPSPADQLLPLIQDELHKLAAQKLAQEKPGQSLQAASPVHAAYVRLVGVRRHARSSAANPSYASTQQAARSAASDLLVVTERAATIHAQTASDSRGALFEAGVLGFAEAARGVSTGVGLLGLRRDCHCDV